MAKSRTIPYGTIVIFAIWLVVMLAVLILWSPKTEKIPQELEGVLRPQPKPLQSFSLIDHHGERFALERLDGKWSFVFFGYTYCPDICPTALATLTAVMRDLRQDTEGKSEPQVIFVSVDPERDNPEKLLDYMAFFDKEYLGVTGLKAEIDGLANQFGAGYIKEPERGPGDYLISHTGSIFLADPLKRLVGSFSQPHDPGTIVSQFRRIREYTGM